MKHWQTAVLCLFVFNILKAHAQQAPGLIRKTIAGIYFIVICGHLVATANMIPVY
jgi:hypothetical protein